MKETFHLFLANKRSIIGGAVAVSTVLLFTSPPAYAYTHVHNLSPITKPYQRSHLSATTTLSSSSPSLTTATHHLLPKTIDRFRGRSILITGASSGLGTSLARHIILCNPSRIILSGRDTTRLENLRSELSQTTTTTIPPSSSSSSAAIIGTTTATVVDIVTCDLSQSSDRVTSSFKNIADDIDVLINNGGLSSRSSFSESSITVDETLMRVNFLSGALLAKMTVPGMVAKKEGMIIWIGSVQGLFGLPYRSSYAASKFAVQGYCESLRAELASSNVSVHVVSPGYIRTNLSRGAMSGDGSSYGKMDDNTAAGADPDDVAVEILNRVASGGESDVMVAATFSARAALWLKFWAPGVLQGLLERRFEKGKRGR